MTSVVTPIAPLRELAHRSSNGVDVTMLWDPATDQVRVAVVDFEIARDPDRTEGEIAKAARASIGAVRKARKRRPS